MMTKGIPVLRQTQTTTLAPSQANNPRAATVAPRIPVERHRNLKIFGGREIYLTEAGQKQVLTTGQKDES
jgi:hypothetical protein